jgi:PAS domain S-box-containing protein
MLHGFAHCEMLFEDGEPRDFVYLDVNATFEKLTGLTGVVGKRVTQVIPGIRESSPELFEIYGRVARTGVPEKFEMFVDALGIWFSISAYSPRKGHFVALFDNITERKRAEEGQKASEQSIRALMENAKDAIFVSNQEGIVLEVNRAAEQLQGRPRSDIVGRPVVETVAPKERASVRQKFEETLSQGSLEGFETLALRADGTTVPIEVSASHVEVGSARLVHAIVRDVSERKRAEREMRRSQERFRRLFESNTIGIAIADLGGRTLEANDAYLEMIGYSREELLAGKIRWDRITPPEHLARDHAAVEQLQRTGVATPWEKELLRKDGTRVPVLLGIAMLDASEASCIAYIVDLSARRQLEEQLRLAQKMEAIGQLAGGIAHDFNNLLTAILGYSDLLAGRLGPDDPGLEDLAEIRRAGERAAALTRQLLAFGRRQVLEPRVLNVNDLIANVEKMLVRVIGEDIALQTRLRLDVSNVLVDPGQLEQVLMNLVVNARDAMPRGGKLTIETANTELSKEYALGHIPVQPGSYVMIAVTDTGIGMNDATRARIFEPFFTTKEKGKGTGLGLATSYGIIKQSGGYIWAYSEEGRGTTFKVYLPRVAAERTDRASAVVGAPAGGTETILLVEDEESVRTLTRKLLERYGYKVLEAPSGEQGIAIAMARAEPIHLLLTDMVMPDMGGADLAARVLALRPEIRVLYTSGYTDDAIFRNGVLDETAAFLQKPFTSEALARKVREVLG